jgi:hypothetical protein
MIESGASRNDLRYRHAAPRWAGADGFRNFPSIAAPSFINKKDEELSL